MLKKEICFCFEIAIQTKIDDILKIDKELALGLSSPTGKVRIVAPMPGTTLVGIYLPTSTENKIESYRVLSTDPVKPVLSLPMFIVRTIALKIAGLFSNIAYLIYQKFE